MGSPIVVYAFARLALRGILALAAGLMVVRLVGSTRQPSLLELAASSPDGIPCQQACLFGIQPGETSGKDAARLLNTHPLTRNAAWIAEDTLRLAESGYYVFFHVTPRGFVESIGMTATRQAMGYTSLKDPVPPAPEASMKAVVLGDYVLTFGVTEVLMLDREYLVFPDSELGTLAVTTQPEDLDQPLDVDIPITALIVSMIPPCGEQDVETGNVWRGFTSLTHYSSRQILRNLTPSRFPMPEIRACQPR